MNSGRITWLAPVVAVMLLVGGGVAQGEVQTLDITENSSTSLTATLNGNSLTVIPQGGDSWLIALTGSVFGDATWKEPENLTTEHNIVVGLGGNISVLSDQPGAGGFPSGAIDVTDFTFNGAQLNVTFTDKGDGPTGVPDAAATLPLLSLSLAGLGILRKKLKR
jgi:hypothetical protein